MSREIRCEFEINATIDEVWQALVEAEQLCRWFAPYTESEPGPDGFIGLAWKDSQDIERMTFSAWEPPSRLILNWHAAPAGVTPIRLPVEFVLAQSNGKTRLSLVQSGFLSDESWDDEFLSHSRGWNTELRFLKHYLENFLGKTRQIFKGKSLANDVDMERIVGPEGLFKTLQPTDTFRPGDSFELLLPGGARTQCKLLYFRSAMDFVCVCDALDGGVIRIAIESLATDPVLMFWAFSWNLAEDQLTRLVRPWYETLVNELDLKDSAA